MKKLLSNKLFWMGWALVMSAFHFGTIIGFVAVLVVSAFYILRRDDKDDAVKYHQGFNALFIGQMTALVIYMVNYCLTL